MWPLSILLLLSMAPQDNPVVKKDYLREQPLISSQAPAKSQPLFKAQASAKAHTTLVLAQEAARRGIVNPQSYTCYAIRSYRFRRQDGNAPVLAGMTTCTPSKTLQQEQVSPEPRVRLVPMGTPPEEQK